MPVRISRLSRQIISAARSILSSPHTCYAHSNLSSEESQAFEQLSNDSTIVVRPADKGGRWVLMDTTDYSNECSRLLQDQTFYRRLNAPLSLGATDPSSILLDLQRAGYITKRELRFLTPSDSPRERRFKILPKIHKSSWPQFNVPPGRPVIADVDSINSNVARLLDFFLQPLVQRLPSFVLDTQHLIGILRSFHLSDSAILATLDVRSLYTNVPIEEGIRRVQRAFDNVPDPQRPDAVLLDLLRTSLLSNDFTFEQDTWLQIKGVAMGKAFGGSFAGLYLGEWERRALLTAPLRPALWKRFQDDIFLVWEHGADSLSFFLRHLNSCDPHIQLDLHFDSHSVRFLDLEIYRGPDSALCYRIGFKATDSHHLLPRDSLHASHVHRGVVYSQVLRWVTRSSTREDFIKTCKVVFPAWRRQGITRAVLRNCVNRVFTLTNLRNDWSFGFFRCDGPRCRACSSASPASVFSSPLLSRVFPILSRLTCATTHCIYVIFCFNCSMLYVGQTSNAAHVRISEHLRDISHDPSASLVSAHFNSNCPPSAFRWCIVDRCFSKDRRLQKEARWIDLLKSKHPLGLNRESSRPISKKLNLVTLPALCTTRLNSVIREACRDAGHNVRLAYKKDANLASLLR